jgi:hypothetical protein
MIEQTNDAGVVEEVRQAFLNYNAALDAGDANALNGFFWNSPSTVRFGPTETLFGYDAISTFRSKQWKGGGTSRVIETVAVTALGRDAATTNAVIRSPEGRRSRQSQTWARLPEGWRIVSAHVSPSPD